jgi:hypothetical protein
VIGGATVTLTHSATSITKTARTSSVGDYVFVNVIPGEYDIVVEAQGFKKAQALRVRLQVEATLVRTSNCSLATCMARLS